MRDLVLQVDPALGRRAGLEQALRHAIRDGRLSPGMILPSTRTLAADLGLARATVVAAYEQLTVEGYIVARQGAGTIVSDIPAVTASVRDDPGSIPRLAIDFRPGEPDNSLFPRAAWLRSVRRAIADSPDHVFGYGHPAGHLKLRVGLAAYLGRSRAVFAKPDDLSIFGGATAAVGFLAELFLTLGIRRIAVEDPSLFLLRDVWQLAGVTPVPVPVDDEGIDIVALERLGLDAVMVTPSHQYPLGITMSADRRAAVAVWARKGGAWIVEDDYDGEFRYDRQPIGALQGLDPERVIYLGTASKSLAPGLRMAWLVVPSDLRPRLATLKHLRGGVSSVDQVALADFIDRGELDRHLRHVRTVYHQRANELATRLRSEVSWLDVPAIQAGLHLTVTITDGSIDEDELVRQAAKRSIGVTGLREHFLAKPTVSGLVLGYSRPPEHGYRQALDQLIEFLSLDPRVQ